MFSFAPDLVKTAFPQQEHPPERGLSLMPNPRMTPEERFRASWVLLPNGCHEWTRLLDRYGYGHFCANNKHWKAHRWAYLHLIGPIPDGLQIDHLCRNRKCVNPAHMELVDQRTNLLRGISFSAVNAAKTHCIRGHEFTESNTRISKHPPGRMCKACQRAYKRPKRIR